MLRAKPREEMGAEVAGRYFRNGSEGKKKKQSEPRNRWKIAMGVPARRSWQMKNVKSRVMGLRSEQ
ncbi:hypothetical protein Csa_013864 [Cucumis sativus]|uniref:Uncharacterized protein n=1 Tax=Cucumis sativus TaxID=3659 RepID=A0A0A0LP40_CUCSA|nr:hypothetical protein Csa_013864 [Cucumis sativus]